MRQFFILASLIVFYCFSKNTRAQNKDSLKVNKQKIDVVYNHYIQDGSNSAVTGGIGTEKLTVYGPSLRYVKQKGRNTWDIKMGSDIISSASTDKIDSIPSSASILDARTYVNGSFGRYQPKKRISWDIGAGASIESDYFSFSPHFGISKVSSNKMRTIEAQFTAFIDDLRWGRLDLVYLRPVMLIYPDELRDREWFSIYRRQSYNLNTGVTQIINKRNVVGLFLFASRQNGLLSTPFHRVYFNNDSLAVERLPNERVRISTTLKWNSFIAGSWIVKNALDAYGDNFGVRGFAISHESIFKVSSKLSLSGDVKGYIQSASRYFAPYKEHNFGSDYFTSDFDLSNFQTLKLGLGLKWKPYLYKKKQPLDLISLRYHYFMRSNGLQSHALSLFMSIPIKN